jgi:uncharacterized membrane protein
MKLRSFSWHPSGWYLLVLVNVLIYILVGLAVRKRAKIALGLCPKHLLRRKVFLWIGWGGFVLGLSIILLGPSGGDALMPGLLIILVALIAGFFGARIAYASKITKEEARLSGCGAPFLDSVESR